MARTHPLTFTNYLENLVEQVKRSEGRRNNGCPYSGANQVSFTSPHFFHIISIYAPAFRGARLLVSGRHYAMT